MSCYCGWNFYLFFESGVDFYVFSRHKLVSLVDLDLRHMDLLTYLWIKSSLTCIFSCWTFMPFLLAVHILGLPGKIQYLMKNFVTNRARKVRC